MRFLPQKSEHIATNLDGSRYLADADRAAERWVIHGKKGAVELLGINPSTLRLRMEKLGIKKPG